MSKNITVRITSDGEAIDIFDNRPDRERVGPHEEWPYYVTFDRVNNEAQIIEWAEQLFRKTWITRKAVIEFLQLVSKAKGIHVTIDQVNQ
jgi:hypothetical protein